MSKITHKSLLVKRHAHYTALPETIFKPRRFFQLKKLQQIKPATLALLVQACALMVVLAMVSLQKALVNAGFNPLVSFSIADFVIAQALVAAAFAYFIGMASWWRWIHFCFPIAMLILNTWQLPNELYLVGFIVTLSLFWTTFRTQVPFYPSRPAVWRQVAKLMPEHQTMRLIDIGSGLGDMSMYIANVRPRSRVEGIEIAPLPWLISFVRGKLSRSNAQFTLGDYRAINFANYDIVFAYLSPAAMLALWQKARFEMKPGSLLISLEFEIPNNPPSMRIAGYGTTPAMYVWRI